MLAIKGFGLGVIAAAALGFPLTGNSEDHASPSILYTPPMLGGGGFVDCPIVNVGKEPLTVTTTYFDNAGKVVGSSGTQVIAPGVVGGASFGLQDGYCQWTVEGSASKVRAAGRVNHFPVTDVYPAERGILSIGDR